MCIVKMKAIEKRVPQKFLMDTKHIDSGHLHYILLNSFNSCIVFFNKSRIETYRLDVAEYTLPVVCTMLLNTLFE